MDVVFMLMGLLLLILGAELLVRGAAALAAIARISPLVVGLTVVAFGTSAPELAVSTISSIEGDAAIALGNVIGSNVFNVLLILGASAAIVPLSVSSQLVRLDVPVMIAASFGAWLAACDGKIVLWEGAVMFLAFIFYTLWLIRMGRQDFSSQESEPQGKKQKATVSQVMINLLLVGVGLALLVAGAQFLVKAATAIASHFGVSDIVIGLTIVAAGTSLPELATSIVAAIKGQRDIAVGNVVGSNVFNLLAVLSTAAMVSRDGIVVDATVLWFDFGCMVLVALLCWPFFLSHSTVSRGEGLVMLLLYFVYTTLLVMAAYHYPGVTWLQSAFIGGVLPIILLVAFGLSWRARRYARQV